MPPKRKAGGSKKGAGGKKAKQSSKSTKSEPKLDGKADGDSKSFFPSVGKIPYKPDAKVADVLVFKYYNAKEVVLGKTMEDWLKFAVCYWHTFRWPGTDPFGLGTISRPWDDGSSTVENAQRRIRAAFEFFSKLGVKYWTFHDRDIAPEGKDLKETNSNLDAVVDVAEQLQKETGIRPLWGTANLFSNSRYMNGASTNPDAHVLAYAGAQVKKAIEITHRLGGSGFVFWGGREGYHTLLNTDVRKELDHMAAFFRMVVKFVTKIGFKGQLLIEPKPKEPTSHQYDYDAQTVIGFLEHYHLDKHFKLNIEPNHTQLAGHNYSHDLQVASAYGMLGSIDANSGTESLGWDTDQFPMDIKHTTWLMKIVIEQGGLVGGLNFDAKPRRESTDIEDLFIAHIGGMDALARGLRNAAKLIEDQIYSTAVSSRYFSYNSGFGASVENGKATLEDCETYVLKNGEPEKRSGKQEVFESQLNRYLQ
jgi:xylose isomerase